MVQLNYCMYTSLQIGLIQYVACGKLERHFLEYNLKIVIAVVSNFLKCRECNLPELA